MQSPGRNELNLALGVGRQDSVPLPLQPPGANNGLVLNESYGAHHSFDEVTSPPPEYDYIIPGHVPRQCDGASPFIAPHKNDLSSTTALPSAPPPAPGAPIAERPTFAEHFKAPVGHDVMNLLSHGNIVFLLPRTSVDRRPLYINPLLGGLGERIVHGGGLFTDESKFVVSVPREHTTENIISLENVKHKGRYLCVDRRGRIKARDGYKDSCDFFVYKVGDSSLVCFESARSDGLYLGIKSNNSPSNTANITASSEEAHFAILADQLSDSVPFPKLKVFGTNSIMNEVRDRTVVRLFLQRRYLGIDKKGRVVQTHNNENADTWFLVYNRGMGVVSLRSYSHENYWLRLQDGHQLVGKGKIGLDAFFTVRESIEHKIILESVAHPGTFMEPTTRTSITQTPQAPEFILEKILEKPVNQ